MPSFNVIAYSGPISDSEADYLVEALATHSPVVDGDGTIVLTMKADSQNYAIGFAVVLLAAQDIPSITQVEVMPTETYDEMYVHVGGAQGDRQASERKPS
jgi:hypothetical protein